MHLFIALIKYWHLLDAKGILCAYKAITVLRSLDSSSRNETQTHAQIMTTERVTQGHVTS